METEKHVKLTAAELSQIWAGYQNDTMLRCVLQYFRETVEDPDIQLIVEDALNLSMAQIEKLVTIFDKEDYPRPVGFTDRDVDINAPRLYSDTFILYYLHQSAKLGINAMSVAVALSTRHDIYSFFDECLSEYVHLHKTTTDLLLSKGLYIRSPHLPTPRGVDFVKDKSFLSGFGDKRPLVSLEVTNLFDNIQRNALGASTVMGFAQVARSKKVAKYFVQGQAIAEKHVEIFGSELRKDNLNVPMTWAMEVTDSTVPPFSDKLMMFHTTALIAIGMGYYGASMATAFRSDLIADYARLTAEIAKYSGEGAKLMIENGWMEEPPQVVDRKELVRQKK
ncbi:MAG TPA: DUF3231 family protein [Bacillales bacterium]|nr:DUF3231 family protein [Bacillales bacterium]